MSLISPRRELDEFRKRYKWMALVVSFVFAGIMVRLVQLQLIQGETWTRKAQENITKTIRYPASRGEIFDTRGRLIATNKASYQLLVTPSLLADGDVERIASLMQLSRDEKLRFETRLARVKEHRRTQQLSMMQNITRDQVAVLETHSAELPAVDVISVPRRSFPFGELGSHTIGYMNEVNVEDLATAEKGTYRIGDRLGRFGVEKSGEGTIRGKRGHKRVVVDVRSRAKNGISRRVAEEKLPESGQKHRLTLDMQLMSILQKRFARYESGMAAVVDVNTGKVRALYSKPSFDSNQMSGRLSVQDSRALLDNPFRPLIDRCLYETYFPGSTFKPFSAFAFLSTGVTPSERVECIGFHEVGRQRMRCTKVHHEVDLHHALMQSCNVYFWKHSENVPLETINKFARAFGFGEPSGIGINGEAKGFLASREWYIKHYKKFRVGYTLNTSIGQGNTRVTGLQLALAYAAIANGGKLYKPILVERVGDGATRKDTAVVVRRDLQNCRASDKDCVNIPAEHFRRVQAAMVEVVNSEGGTAYNSKRHTRTKFAGKTGTAELVGRRENIPKEKQWYFRRSHAWFAGYAPADNPELAIALVVEHGGAGGKTAAPIAIESLDEYFAIEASRPKQVEQ